MKHSIWSSIKVIVTNLLQAVDKVVGARSALLHVEHNKVILEEMVGRVTQPAVQDRNVFGKVPGQRL